MKQFNDKFEEQLQAALCRQEPGSDFADRVLARAASLPQPERPAQQEGWRARWRRAFQFNWTPPQWAAVSGLAVLLIIAAVAFRQHQHQAQQRRAAEIAEGERAKEQVMLAMRIASNKLNVAQRKVQESSER